MYTNRIAVDVQPADKTQQHIPNFLTRFTRSSKETRLRRLPVPKIDIVAFCYKEYFSCRM